MKTRNAKAWLYAVCAAACFVMSQPAFLYAGDEAGTGESVVWLDDQGWTYVNIDDQKFPHIRGNF